MELEVKTVISIEDEDIEDIVVTALEGGIGYWAYLDNSGAEFETAPDDEPISITATKILLDGKRLRFLDKVYGKKECFLTLDKLLDGIKIWYEKGYDYYGAVVGSKLDCGCIDALCADMIFQFAMFGEWRYVD